MAIQEANAHVIVTWQMLGEKAVTHLVYAPETAYEATTGPEFLTSWLAACQTPWRAATATLATLARVDVDIRSDVQSEASAFPNLAGSRGAGDVLPPHNAAGFSKEPYNDAIYPIGATPFREGGLRIMGQLEADQVNGAWISTYMTALQALADALRVVEVDYGEGTQDWGLIMIRPAGTFEAPTARAFVQTLAPKPLVTSQNSRKLR